MWILQTDKREKPAPSERMKQRFCVDCVFFAVFYRQVLAFTDKINYYILLVVTEIYLEDTS